MSNEPIKQEEEDYRIVQIKAHMYANKGNNISLEELDELEKRVIELLKSSSGDFKMQLKWLRKDIRRKYLWMRYKKGREKKNQYSARTLDMIILQFESKEQKQEFTVEGLLL